MNAGMLMIPAVQLRKGIWQMNRHDFNCRHASMTAAISDRTCGMCMLPALHIRDSEGTWQMNWRCGCCRQTLEHGRPTLGLCCLALKVAREVAETPMLTQLDTHQQLSKLHYLLCHSTLQFITLVCVDIEQSDCLDWGLLYSYAAI